MLMSSVSMLSLMPLLTELLSSQLDTHTPVQEETLILNSASSRVKTKRKTAELGDTRLNCDASYPMNTTLHYLKVIILFPFPHFHISFQAQTHRTLSTAKLK